MTVALVPLRRYVTSIKDGTHGTHERVPEGIPLLSAKNIQDGSVVMGSEESQITLDEYLAIHRSGYLAPGDVLLTIVGTIGRTAIYNGESAVAFQRSVASLRPAGHCHGRFLFYCLSSTLAQEQLAASAHQAAQSGVYLSDVAQVAIPLLPLADQRAIADYLDRETARIDALIAAKRQMARLLEERWQGFLEREIRAVADQHGEIPLKHVCREVVVGIVITPSAWYADTGVPAIRGTNVSPGTISTDDLVYLTKEGHELHPKSRLRSGDVVVVRTGQAGAAAVVPPELDGINCIDLVIVRLRHSYSPHFLDFVMNSDWMQKHIAEYSVGTIQSHFNVAATGLVPVPRAPLTEQNQIVDRLRRERTRIGHLVSVVQRQMSLLQELRQTVIAAAVTGQLDISEAA